MAALVVWACAALAPPLSGRRAVLEGLAAAAVAGAAPASAATADEKMTDYTTSRGLDQEPVVKGFVTLPSGVRYADLKPGSGPEAAAGSRVSLQWVLRRSNGYYVDGSVNVVGVNVDQKQQFDPYVFTLGDGRAMAGFDEGVVGIRQGGVRRIIIPLKDKAGAPLAYTLPLEKSGGPLPEGFGPQQQLKRELNKQDPYNYVYFEVEAARVTARK